jgi:hypothetical protein
MAVILNSDGVTVVEATDVFTANDPWGRSARRTAGALARALDAIGLINDRIDTHRLTPGPCTSGRIVREARHAPAEQGVPPAF